MKNFYIVFIGTLLVASYVSAGGFLSAVDIANSKLYTRNNPSSSGPSKIFRPITSAEGIKDANNPDLGCGPGSTDAFDLAYAQPGDSIFFFWSDWNGTISKASRMPLNQ